MVEVPSICLGGEMIGFKIRAPCKDANQPLGHLFFLSKELIMIISELGRIMQILDNQIHRMLLKFAPTNYPSKIKHPFPNLSRHAHTLQKGSNKCRDCLRCLIVQQNNSQRNSRPSSSLNSTASRELKTTQLITSRLYFPDFIRVQSCAIYLMSYYFSLIPASGHHLRNSKKEYLFLQDKQIIKYGSCKGKISERETSEESVT